MSTPDTAVQEWRDIDWAKVEIEVHTLQRRIYRASQKGERKLIHRLQRLLLSSRSAKLLAVRRVTQDNQGKKTAGIDGVLCLEPEERLPLVEALSLEAKPKPVRRVWIPKPGSDEQRPLGIPTIHDRAVQALVKLALEPEWEARFEPNSYGFRPGRSAHDAVAAIFTSINKKEKYALDADIAKCFDRINHDALLDKLQTFPSMRRIIKAWLKAGVLDGDTLFPSDAGAPQGGVISPLLANIALHGLEEAIRSRFPTHKWNAGTSAHWKPTVVRYADDFVILHQDESVIRECQGIAQEWLKGMGLELKPSKTRIAHTLHEVDGVAGFDFLGFAIRQYPVGKYRSGKAGGRILGFKTIIKPSKAKVKLHQQQLAKLLRQMTPAPQAQLIHALNSRIKGWCNYYRAVSSSRTFHKVSGVLYQLLMCWAKRRHPKKSVGWRVRKYWLLPRWTFGTKDGKAVLSTHSETKIHRHVKVKDTKSPFDGDWSYWATRQAYYPGVSPWEAMLLKKQKGKCLHCGLIFQPDDQLEAHHVYHDLQRQGWHLELLHRHCHDQRPSPEYRLAPEGSAHDQG